MTKERKATLISSSVAGFLTVLKLGIGLASGSVAVLASAVDSILDMFVSIFNYLAISSSEKPADKDFNYGRGKIEAIASVIEGTIIFVSGLFLLYHATQKAYSNEIAIYINEALVVMTISLIVTIVLVLYLNKIAKITKNMLIKTDALHYKTDVYTNVSVLISLILVKFTSYELIDVLIGSAIAIYIMYSAYLLIKEGILVLLDKALDLKCVEKIIQIIQSEKQVNAYHLLKTREAGNNIFVEVHLVYNCIITLMEAHKVTDKIESKIQKLDVKKKWIINIHMDPYDDFTSDN